MTRTTTSCETVPRTAFAIMTLFTAAVILSPAMDRHICKPEEFLLIAGEGPIRAARVSRSLLPDADHDDKVVI